MAASPGGEEDSVYDTGRLSLFDLILEKTRAQNKVTTDNLVSILLIPFCWKILWQTISRNTKIFSCRKTSF